MMNAKNNWWIFLIGLLYIGCTQVSDDYYVSEDMKLYLLPQSDNSYLILGNGVPIYCSYLNNENDQWNCEGRWCDDKLNDYSLKVDERGIVVSKNDQLFVFNNRKKVEWDSCILNTYAFGKLDKSFIFTPNDNNRYLGSLIHDDDFRLNAIDNKTDQYDLEYILYSNGIVTGKKVGESILRCFGDINK